MRPDLHRASDSITARRVVTAFRHGVTIKELKDRFGFSHRKIHDILAAEGIDVERIARAIGYDRN